MASARMMPPDKITIQVDLTADEAIALKSLVSGISGPPDHPLKLVAIALYNVLHDSPIIEPKSWTIVNKGIACN